MLSASSFLTGLQPCRSACAAEGADAGWRALLGRSWRGGGGCLRMDPQGDRDDDVRDAQTASANNRVNPVEQRARGASGESSPSRIRESMHAGAAVVKDIQKELSIRSSFGRQSKSFAFVTGGSRSILQTIARAETINISLFESPKEKKSKRESERGRALRRLKRPPRRFGEAPSGPAWGALTFPHNTDRHLRPPSKWAAVAPNSHVGDVVDLLTRTWQA
jgi:hypothetical protein